MTTSTQRPTLTPEEVRVRRAHLLVTSTLLLVSAAVYVAAVALAGPDLPDRLAVHFGIDGRADRTMATPVALLSFGLVALGVPVLLLVVLAAGQWWRGASARSTSGLVGGLVAGLVVLFVHLLWAQRGLVDPTQARLLPVAGLWAIGTALAVGLLAAAVLPRALPQPAPLVPEPLSIAPSDRVSWFGVARTSQTALSALAVAVLVVVVATLASGIWWLWLVVVLLAVLVPATTSFRVTVDRTGLTWRSALGVPRGHVPLEEVTGVSVADVRPGDFGGYGIRSVPGATGLVTRHGPALQVLHGQRRLVVTVDDAVTAASVLEGLRLRP